MRTEGVRENSGMSKEAKEMKSARHTLEEAMKLLFEKARKWEEITGLPGDCFRAWAFFLKWMVMFLEMRDPTLFGGFKKVSSISSTTE